METQAHGAVSRAPALEYPVEQLRARAERLAGLLRAGGVDARTVESLAAVGGGAAPGVDLPSVAVSVPSGFARPLRAGQPPVVGRTAGARCPLDLRTVDPRDDERLYEAVLAARDAVTATG